MPELPGNAKEANNDVDRFLPPPIPQFYRTIPPQSTYGRHNPADWFWLPVLLYVDENKNDTLHLAIGFILSIRDAPTDGNLAKRPE